MYVYGEGKERRADLEELIEPKEEGESQLRRFDSLASISHKTVCRKFQLTCPSGEKTVRAAYT